MTSKVSSAALQQTLRVKRLSQFLLAVAAAALALMPLAMWLANRSAPLCLGISAIACVAVVWCENWPLADKLRMLRAMRSPQTKVILLFLSLAAISLLWSHNPRGSFFAWVELVIPMLSGVVVAVVLPPRAPRWLAMALAASLVLALLLSLAELIFGTGLREALGLRTMTFIFNRSLICAMLIAIPLIGWLIGRKQFLLALILVLATASAIFMSESGAAKLGLMLAVLSAMAAVFAPRLSLIATSAALVALIVFAPVQGEIAEQLIPPSAHRQLQDSHSRDRVDIWLSFGEAIRARPLLGAGFGTSPTLHEHPVAAEVSPQRFKLLAVGHPHSAEVQVWTELGVVGAGLMLWAGILLVLSIGKSALTRKTNSFNRYVVIAPLAALACAVSIAAVGHGAWQGWWIATLAASMIWFRIFEMWDRQHGQKPAMTAATQKDAKL